MLAQLQSAWRSNRHWLAAGFLLASTLYVLLTFLNWREHRRGIAQSAGAGLGATAQWEPISLWQQRSVLPSFPRRHVNQSAGYYQKGVVGGVPGGIRGGVVGGVLQMQAALPNVSEREVVRSGVLLIVAPNSARASEQVSALAARLSGFVVSSTLSGNDQNTRSAQVVVRIPADRFEEARSEIRKLAASVDQDSTEARDVTRQSADQRATLRNYRAEETQYLAIMKRAVSVKDVLEVSEKLADVRGRIDRLETEMRDLHQEVAMSLLTVGITSVAEAQVLGLKWRPLYEAKLSARSALAALADFADAVVAFVFYVPVILLWGVLVLVVLKLGWLALSRLARLLFPGLPLWRAKSVETQAS
ncbi:MAG: DUF4349 domain-containing protein [Acidobacteriia bacterium]|nr:DUF4349 domain-containing protein [Terriglobia bacterium]